MIDLANCPDCNYHPISKSARSCPQCGCTIFVRLTGNEKVELCKDCIGYPKHYCNDCHGTGKVNWVEWKDFRSGRVAYYVRGVDPNE